MKNFLLFTLLLFAALTARGQTTTDIELCVDYSCVSGVDGFAAQQIQFQGGPFDGFRPLVNTGNDVWCGTFALPAGEVRYNFFFAGAAGAGGPEDLSGLACASDGVGGLKRTYTVVEGVTETVTVAWESCEATAMCGAGGPTDIELCVDYSCVSGVDGFAAQQIQFQGGPFDGFRPLINTGNDVWCGTFALPAGEVRYNFFFAGAAGAGGPEDLSGLACTSDGVGGLKRSYTVVEGVSETVTFAWESCEAAPVCDDGGSTTDIEICVDYTCVSGTPGFAAQQIQFQGGPFDGFRPLVNTGNDVWCGTFALPAGEVRYNFFYAGAAGAGGGEDLSGLDGEACVSTGDGGLKRTYTVVEGVTETVTFAWESCDATPVCAGPAGAMVDFCVDVSCLDNVESVSIFGSFVPFGQPGFFDPNFIPPFVEDPANPGIYCGTVFVPEGQLEYKFLINVGGAQEEEMFMEGEPCTVTPFGFTNRFLDVVDGVDQQVTAGWNSCDAECTPPPGAEVEYCVDIGCIMPAGPVNVFGTFEPQGGFLFFNPTATPMMDPDGDGIYCATVFLPPGDVEFKFLIDFGLPTFQEEMFQVGDDCTVSCCDGQFTNRVLTVVDGVDQTTGFVFNVPCESTLVEPELAFEDAEVCDGDDVVTITGGATPAGGVYSGTGVTDNGDGLTYDMDLSMLANAGNEITYTFAGDLECEYTTTAMLAFDTEDPTATVTNQLIILTDAEPTMTLDTDDFIVAGDNCPGPLNFTFDRSLTFGGDDIGTNTVTLTVTDVRGNTTVIEFVVVVGFEQPELACIGEINLTLNDECQGLLVPQMLLTGNTNLLDAFELEIRVMDNDPSNGAIVDGCGSFQYMISSPLQPGQTVNGFTGALAEANWTVETTSTNANQVAEATFSATTLNLSTSAEIFSTGAPFGVSADLQFSEDGELTFDYDYNGVDNGFDDAIIVFDFEGNIVETVLDTDEPESGSATVAIESGYTLMIDLQDDGFQPFAGAFTSELEISNISFTTGDLLGLDFETCWGIVNAEDKTPPAVVSTPADVELLCVDFENDRNNVSTLPASVSKCYLVNSSTGATIPGSMAPALRTRLLAGGVSPLVPTFTDGCTNEIEVCVNDVVTLGDDPSCDDIVLVRTFTATEVSICASDASETNPSVATSYEITFVRPSLADLTSDNIDSVVEYDQCGTANPTQADYPAPRPADFPFLVVGDRTFPLQNGEAVCNIGVTFSDGTPIVTCPFTYKFIRTYTVIDWCDPSDIRTFTQVVKVGDVTAPTFTGPSAPTNAAGDLVFGTNAGNICAAYLRLDDVSAIDDCSGTNVNISAEIYPGGDLTGTPIGAFNVVPGGTPELSSAIPVGRHLLRYTFEDECGNADFEDFFFVVEDQTPPVAICEDGLNISIAGGTNDGFAVLTPDNIDAGSYDDCSGITRAIARVNANNLPIGGYRNQISLTCADIGTVRVGLRVTDALGNENFCWLDVLVEDKLAPTCVAPGDVVITCDEYNTTLPADIMDATDETLDALFGTAAGVDNCGTTITQRISGDVNSCGVGSFVRTFTSTDDAGFTNANNCTQNIRVDGVHDYRLTFPVDVSSDCAAVPEYDGVGAEELACDLITTTSDVDTLRTLDAGDECFKLRITYDVINWCEYNSFGEPYLVPRDGDGVNNRQRQPRDLEADPLYVNVLPGATLTTTDDDRAFMTLFTDRVFSPNAPQRDQPIDDNLLSDGDDNDYGDNDVDSRGFFRYVQFVKIYDEVAPEITFTEPTECFSGNNEDCSATVDISFVALDACSDAVVGVELDADFDATIGFVRTTDVTASDDGEGNFTVNLTNVPVGEHALRVRASDGCGNFDVQIIEFCVEADKSPTPICIQTLTVTLMDDGNGGGVAAIWASDFIASPIVDCFGNPVTKYSLYRTSEAEMNAFVPVVGQVGVDDINCADVGNLAMRVYAFDDNGSTPDFCEVVVEVQDNEPWCGGSTGDLTGLVLTPADEAVEGVLMTLTGGMDATTTSDATGAFEFRNVQFDEDYTVQPSYEAAFSSRDVKTSDLVAAISDILGTQAFDSPYDYIAADVNRDGEHDVRDVVMSSRAILGITNGYASGNWSFTTADAVIDINNPYGEVFPEVYNVNDLQGSFRAADFVAIMMGDLVQGNGRSAQNLNTEDVRLAAGQTHTVVLDGAHLAGFQGTIELAAGLELVSADYVGEGGLNLNRAAEGLVAVALRNEASLTLEVRATEAGLLSELISLNDAITVREGVAANGLSSGLGLAFNGAALAPATAPNALYQNTPNPVLDVTSISFELATAGAATLTIQDAAGRLILTRQLDAAAGLNRVDLDNIQATGVLTYTLTSGDFTASKKMVVVK